MTGAEATMSAVTMSAVTAKQQTPERPGIPKSMRRRSLFWSIVRIGQGMVVHPHFTQSR
jgi:hypothetical protein